MVEPSKIYRTLIISLKDFIPFLFQSEDKLLIFLIVDIFLSIISSSNAVRGLRFSSSIPNKKVKNYVIIWPVSD